MTTTVRRSVKGEAPKWTGYHRILWPTDFSPLAKTALPHAVGLAMEANAELVLLHVLPSPGTYVVADVSGAVMIPLLRKSRAAAQAHLRQLEKQVAGPHLRMHTVLTEGVPFHQIIRAAKRLRCDLIVLATHGRTGLVHAIMGSVTENVLRRAPCPVLVVRPARFQSGAQGGCGALAPSILAANFARLGEQAVEAAQAGADRIHVDVMDGRFVPNIVMGAPIVKSLRRVTHQPLEIHLMISDPDAFLDEFVEAGADAFLVHWECNRNLHRTVRRIKALGKRAGVAINPATTAAALEEILQDVEQVLIMTVNPGFGHQHFLPTPLQKIRRIRQETEQMTSGCDTQVNGGIDADTAPLAVAAGANVLVAGTAIFGEREDVAAAMDRLRASITQLGNQPRRVE